MKKYTFRKICFLPALIFWYVFAVSFQTSVFPEELRSVQAANPVKIVDSDDQSIIVELTADKPHIETTRMKPGEPQIPVYGALFGVSSLDNVSVHVLDAEYETMRGYHIPPAPSLQTNSNNFLDIQGTASTEKNQNPAAHKHDGNI